MISIMIYTLILAIHGYYFDYTYTSRQDTTLLAIIIRTIILSPKKKKKKNKGSNYTLTSETYQPTSKRLILRPSSRPNLLLLNFKKRKKKSTQFDKIVKKITRRCRTYHSSTTTSEKKIYSRRVKNSTHRTTHWTRLSTIFFRMNPFDEGRGERGRACWCLLVELTLTPNAAIFSMHSTVNIPVKHMFMYFSVFLYASLCRWNCNA